MLWVHPDKFLDGTQITNQNLNYTNKGPSEIYSSQGIFDQIVRGLRVFRGVFLKGGYCSLNLKDDEDDNEAILATFEDINIELILKDEFGSYGIKFTHPVRLHYFIT